MTRFTQSSPMSRRSLLRGFGIGMALPFLDAMIPASRLLAATGASTGSSIAGSGAASPLRMAFIYVPNGVHVQDWTLKETGKLNKLSPLLKNLEAFKDELLVVSNLAQHRARANGDGPGDHARSMATFLTGMQARKTSGADIRAGVSIDQLAARLVGGSTRFASLELGIDRSRQSGECDSGYSCAYSSNISWKTENMPVPAETNPRLVFERLFGSGAKLADNEGRAIREKYQKSVLDFVLDDAGSLNKKLSRTDQRKMDEYLTSVRELEQRLVRSELETKREMPKTKVPEGVPQAYDEHVDLMIDMLVLAFQTDSTRVATFPFANEGSQRSYTNLGISDGHHELSHHGGDQKKLEKISKINHYHMQKLASFAGKLKAIKEGDKTLLDNSMIAYGSCIGDGNRHNHDHLPIAVLGRAGGALKTGQHIKMESETPLNNLWLTMLELAGSKTDALGDSTGRIKDIVA